MKNVTTYTKKNSTWINAAGDHVPVKFVPASDIKKEALAAKVLKAALHAEEVLNNLYAQMSKAFDDVKEMIMEEYEIKKKQYKPGKGCLTWYNFDRSIKIEADVNEIVKWDDALMTEALHLLNNYISSNMTDANLLISELVKSAFANTKGMIDTGKVFQILRYQDKIKAQKFQQACELIKKAQSIDRTKLYMRVWVKTEAGDYRSVNLNFSSL